MSRSAAWASRIVVSTRSVVTRSSTCRMPMWVVTCTTRSLCAVSIIAKSRVPVRSARISVCPG